MHARSVSIKNTRHLYAQSVLAVVIKEQCFSAALAFVVAAAYSNWIDAATIAFDLRVNLRIAVHLARRRLQYLGTQALGESQHVNRTVHTGLGGLNRVVLIMYRRGRASQIV